MAPGEYHLHVDLLAGKRILLTGGSGFLGKRVLDRLADHDVAEVIAPRSAEYDLRERDEIRAALAAARPATSPPS
jgi:GDP-L-fucose synthase